MILYGVGMSWWRIKARLVRNRILSHLSSLNWAIQGYKPSLSLRRSGASPLGSIHGRIHTLLISLIQGFSRLQMNISQLYNLDQISLFMLNEPYTWIYSVQVAGARSGIWRYVWCWRIPTESVTIVLQSIDMPLIPETAKCLLETQLIIRKNEK